MEQINCPICLEDIFNISTPSDFNITILCCHTCNWKCLVGCVLKDMESAQTCPLCRYYQNPQETSHCDDCEITNNYMEQSILRRNNNQIEMSTLQQYTLWTCLICGHIGCFNLMTKAEANEEEIIVRNVQKGHAF